MTKRSIIVLLCIWVSTAAYQAPPAVASFLDRYRSFSELTSAASSMDADTYARNIATWQMDHGGFSSSWASNYQAAWNGSAVRSSTRNGTTELGSFDNGATIAEIRFLADRFRRTTDALTRQVTRSSVDRALGFLLTAQHPGGSWPQVYPRRNNYSDMATFNDDAMVRVMVLARDIVDRRAPFDGDLVSSSRRTALESALVRAVEFVLRAQIPGNDGRPTVWCAQHDPVSLAPVMGRAFELPSRSASESRGIAVFLMNWPEQNDRIRRSVRGAFAWYHRTRVSDLRYSSGVFSPSPGASLWYRFYDIETDRGFFSDRDSRKVWDISQISEERRTGYAWAGNWGTALLDLEDDWEAALVTSAVRENRAAPGIVRAVHGTVVLDADRFGPVDLRWRSLSGRMLGTVRAFPDASGRVHAEVPAGTNRGVLLLEVSSQSGLRFMRVLRSD